MLRILSVIVFTLVLSSTSFAASGWWKLKVYHQYYGVTIEEMPSTYDELEDCKQEAINYEAARKSDASREYICFFNTSGLHNNQMKFVNVKVVK